MKQTQSEMELDITKVNNAEPKSNGAAKQEKASMWDKIKSIPMFFTVEPFLLCYILPNVISALAVQKLNMEKACRADLGYSEDICSKVVAGDVSDNITMEALNGAQRMVADMTAWKQPVQSGIPAIVILFVGAWSDKTGNRKTLMLVPIIGEFISGLGMILTTYYFLEWPLWVTALIEAIPPAFTGGWSIALMGAYSYIADVTTIESRTFRVGIVAVIVTLGIPLGSSISGILTEAVGYYGIFGIGMLLYALGYFHTYFRVHDIRRTEVEGTCCEKFIEFFNPKYVWDTISLVIMARGRRLAQVLLVIWAHIVIIGPVFGEGPLLYLYTLRQFSMDVVDFSLFSTYSILMSVIGTAIAVTVFSKLLKMHDALIGVIATACKVISSFVYGFAPTRGWLYSGPAFDIFGNSGVTAIRSLGTKIVNPDEVGKMCSLIGFVEAVVPVIYTPIYSIVYSNTVETYPGLFYVIGGLMTIPAFFIFMWAKQKLILQEECITIKPWKSYQTSGVALHQIRVLYIMHKRQERDVVKDPHSKEMYARENAVTSL